MKSDNRYEIVRVKSGEKFHRFGVSQGVAHPARRAGDGWDIVCENCCKVFHAKVKQARFCSRWCSIRNRELKEHETFQRLVSHTRKCAVRGCNNRLPEGARSNHRFCSNTCRQRNYRLRMLERKEG